MCLDYLTVAHSESVQLQNHRGWLPREDVQTSLRAPGIYGMLQLVTDGNEEWGMEGSCVKCSDRGALLGSGFPSVLSESGAGLQKGVPDKFGSIGSLCQPLKMCLQSKVEDTAIPPRRCREERASIAAGAADVPNISALSG